MKILVINSGSSSIKYQLINMKSESVLAKGLVERIGIEGSRLEQEVNGEEIEIEQEIADHGVGMELVIDTLTNKETGVISSVDEINAVGHRVVQGGKYFDKSVIIDQDVKEKIEECATLAPLHNPPNLMGIEVCEELMPHAKQIATFDSAFHQTMPEEIYMYALPYELYEKHDIRRYGAHGTSHKFVAKKVAKEMSQPIEDLKIITCHLGNGASVTAVKNGKSYDTSMGLTPLEGLVMGTRCGDLDPAAVPFIMEKEDLNPQEMDDLMNNESGLKGISGISSDMRDIGEAAAEGNERAQLALDMFVGRVKKYIGSYTAEMNGVDAIVFTAGIGENAIELREQICSNLDYLGIELDSVKNDVRGATTEISADESNVKVYVIPTNEELVIARDAKKLID
ncbi:acetate kinase [Halobacteroides halobius DSM 5150]|uniref:Acetate kinase n=1 Tax=Halobacteroides halobius (strain ATCC 35273 / DSM 5150 / MD-1) TaxID=748449 RepID=L0K9T4_HALHC|nr:acetate kinase [Halobacteroides halobius]AGB42072.1 acetate kinase [Halobacteroides halobius DSM 5150]